LLMDDDEFIIKSVSGILSYMGFETDIAHDGKEAFDKYKNRLDSGNPFSVVIMDLTIPGGVGGKAAIGMLREIDPNVRAIVSSGYSDDPVMAEYSRHGFKGVILKPYRPQDLVDTIRRISAM
ncbi:MAG: response regulator, partial [Spirochaetota bacterium]